MVTLRCPNDCIDKIFVTHAHVAETWLIDNDGDFIEVIDTGEVVSGPDMDEAICHECNTKAVVGDTYKDGRTKNS